MSRFIKYIPDSEMADFLDKKPLANHLALIIAKRARRTDCKFTGLKIGQCFLGDFKSIGLSEQQYRTAKKVLQKIGFATFKGTRKGTVATLVSIDVWNINVDQGNGQTNGQLTDKQRTANGQLTTNKNVKKEKNDKNDKNIISSAEAQNSKLIQEIQSLKAELKKEKEKSSAKKEQVVQQYNPCLGTASGGAEINRLWPMDQDLADDYKLSRGFSPDLGIIKEARKSFIEKGFGFHKYINSEHQLKDKLFSWIDRQKKGQNETAKKKRNSNVAEGYEGLSIQEGIQKALAEGYYDNNHEQNEFEKNYYRAKEQFEKSQQNTRGEGEDDWIFDI